MFLSASLVVVLSLLAACGQGTSTPTPASSAVAGPTATATRAPARVLTVCLGQEPASLFPVTNPSAAAQSVLAAIYDGPIDTNSYGYQPVILKDLPSLQNGDAQVFSKAVTVGDEVVDANGTPVTLQAGVTVRPAGCTNDSCAIKYDGSSSLQMDQMQATFRLLPGLTWSDGEPLTADDSVYAYQVASSPKIQGSKKLVERTQSYEAADATTIQWWGRPGFIDQTFFTNFWAPLPRHLWSQIPFDQLGTADQSAKMPTGWGAYILK
jgi:peptide/nickel transport system substrate-binding protein